MATRNVVQSGPWSAAATWGGTFPGETDFGNVPAGLTLEVDVMDVAIKRLIHHGTLKLSRTVSSRIIYKGSLIGHHGTFDGGFFNDRIPSTVTHELVFDYAESGLVAGPIPEPHPDPALASSSIYDSNAGWFAMHDGFVFAHGALVDPWSVLTANAAAGGTTCSVDGRWTFGWEPGGELVFAMTDMPAESNPTWQHEYRNLLSLGGAVGDASRLLTLQGGQTFAFLHEQWSKAWTDRWGQAWTELLQGEVAYVTRNIIVRGARATDRSHAMFMDGTRFYVDCVRFKDMGPKVKPNLGDKPMGHYPLHAHDMRKTIQPVAFKTDSYVRRSVFDGDPTQERGWGTSIHQTDGIEVSENTYVGMGTSVASGSAVQGNGLVCEDTTPLSAPGGNGVDGLYRSAEDIRIFRNLFMRTGHKDSPGQDDGAIWTGRGMSAQSRSVLADNHMAGHDGAGQAGAMSWPQTNAAESLTGPRDLTGRRMPMWGLVSHSHRSRAMKLRTNALFRPVIDLVDIVAWRCRHGIDQHGAYASGWHIHGIRAWEWGPTSGFEHTTHSRLVTDFLLDGGGLNGGAAPAGLFGIGIGNYVASSVLANEDSIYEMGVARNLVDWFSEHLDGGGSADFPMWIQFSRVDHGGFKIRYGAVAFSPTQGTYGTHPQEGSPPFHDRDVVICGVAKGIGYGDYSIIRIRNAAAASLPNTPDVSFDLRHVWDTLAPGSEPALPEDYGRSTRTSDTYPNPGSNAGAKKSNVAGTDLARELPPKIKWIAPAGRYSAEPAAAGDGTRLITLTFETDATEGVEIYEVLTDAVVEKIFIPKPAGPATWQGTWSLYDMEQHPYRWAVFAAETSHSREADVNTTNGSTTVTAPAGTFKSGDASKRIMIEGAGSGGGRLTTTIASFVSSSQITLAAAAGNTVSGAEAVINAHPTGGDRQIRVYGKDTRFVYKQLDAAAPPPPPPASGLIVSFAD